MSKYLRTALPLILLLSINCLAQNGAESKIQDPTRVSTGDKELAPAGQ